MQNETTSQGTDETNTGDGLGVGSGNDEAVGLSGSDSASESGGETLDAKGTGAESDDKEPLIAAGGFKSLAVEAKDDPGLPEDQKVYFNKIHLDRVGIRVLPDGNGGVNSIITYAPTGQKPTSITGPGDFFKLSRLDREEALEDLSKRYHEVNGIKL